MLYTCPSAAQIVSYFLSGPGALEIGILKLHGTNFQVNLLTIVRLSVFQDILR